MKMIIWVLIILVSATWSVNAQVGEVMPSENLVVDGVPKIPTSLAEKADRYTSFRTALLLSWHPLKRTMLVGTRFCDTVQVHQLDSPGGARTQLTFFNDAIRGASFQPKFGKYLVFEKDIGGNEFDQIYRYDLATGEVTLLTDGKSRNILGAWSQAGDRIAYTSTRRNGKDSDLYIINPSDPKSDSLFAQLEGGGWEAPSWSPDDRKIIVRQRLSQEETYLWMFDVDSGAKSLITLPQTGTEKVFYSEAQFTKDGRGIYLATDKDSEFRRMAYFDLTSKRFTFLTENIPWDVEFFDLSPDGMLLAFVTVEDGISVLHILNAANRKEVPGPRIPIGRIYGVNWRPESRELGYTMASARSTTDVFSFDVGTRKQERWTSSETGGINTDNLAEPKLVRWKSFDGRMISGFLYLPPARFTGKRPIIIDIHGGPEYLYRPGFLGRNNYYLNELGVALLFPNIRGSLGYGKTFLGLDNGFLRENAYKDVGALLNWVQTQPSLDAERLMVTGASYGGHMTLASATFYNERIRCAVDVVGQSNFVTFLQNTESYRRDLRRAEYGDERDPKMRAFLEKIAPINNAGRINKPLFVVQGGNDPRVAPSESEQMVKSVRKNGTPVWYLMAKDEGHGFYKKNNVDFQFYATILFIKQYLLN